MNSNSKIRTRLLSLSALAMLGGVVMGTTSCGRYAESMFYTVKGKDLEVTFCDRAASIYSIKYKDQYMTYHPKDYNTFLTSGYCYGRTLGRVTGRIQDGDLNIDGKHYQLELNETGGTGNKNNSIHGGFNGLPSKDFTRHVNETTDKVSVSFNYVSPHLEAGYPEKLDTWVTYTVYKNVSKIDTYITATSTGKTPVNITTHPFFRLGDSGDILDHKLTIPANNRAEFAVDSNHHTNQVPIGTTPVQDTPFDFRNGQTIGSRIDKARAEDLTSGGYDHIWKFNDGSKYIELYNPANKIKLHVDTDADAIIMYANCFPHEKDEMNPSGKDSLYAGISVEPYKFFTNAAAPSTEGVEGLMINAGQTFKRNISYNFSVEQ